MANSSIAPADKCKVILFNERASLAIKASVGTGIQNVHLGNLLISHQCLPKASRYSEKQESTDKQNVSPRLQRSLSTRGKHTVRTCHFIVYTLMIRLGHMRLLTFDGF